MTGPDGNGSSQAPLRDGTGPIGSPSAAAGGASTSNGGGAEKRVKEPASAVTVGSPRHPRESLKGSNTKATGGEKKRKEMASHDSSKGLQCPKCDKTFASKPALCGHQRVHSGKQEQQAASGNKDMKKAVSSAPVVSPGARLGGMQSKSNMGVHNNQPQQQVQQWSETEGHGSAAAEGDPSSLEEAKEDKRKSVPRNFDLNQPPVDDGNGDEEDA